MIVKEHALKRNYKHFQHYLFLSLAAQILIPFSRRLMESGIFESFVLRNRLFDFRSFIFVVSSHGSMVKYCQRH